MEATEFQKAASAAMKLRQIREKFLRTQERLCKSGPKRHDDYMVVSGQIRALDFTIAFLETHAQKGCKYTEGNMRCIAAAHGRDVGHTLVVDTNGGGES